MAAISVTGAKPNLLPRLLLAASLPRRPAATTAAAAAFSSAAAAASGRGTGGAVLRARLGVAVRRLGALHGSAIVCSATGDGAHQWANLGRQQYAPSSPSGLVCCLSVIHVTCFLI